MPCTFGRRRRAGRPFSVVPSSPKFAPTSASVSQHRARSPSSAVRRSVPAPLAPDRRRERLLQPRRILTCSPLAGRRESAESDASGVGLARMALARVAPGPGCGRSRALSGVRTRSGLNGGRARALYGRSVLSALLARELEATEMSWPRGVVVLHRAGWASYRRLQDVAVVLRDRARQPWRLFQRTHALYCWPPTTVRPPTIGRSRLMLAACSHPPATARLSPTAASCPPTVLPATGGLLLDILRLAACYCSRLLLPPACD